MKVQKASIMTVFFVILLACSPAKKEEATEETATEESTTIATATATLNSASGSSVTGTAKFTQVGDMTVRMDLQVQNLTPGDHALHLHQFGDCSAPDATSAGGHWNPGEMAHGKRGEGEYHAGDVINLTADASGNVSWSDEISGWTIGGADSTNILNKAVIIHDSPDDFATQPTGNAGGRVACGVITN